VPVDDAESQVVPHRLVADLFVRVVMAERKRVLGIRAFEANAFNLGESGGHLGSPVGSKTGDTWRLENGKDFVIEQEETEVTEVRKSPLSLFPPVQKSRAAGWHVFPDFQRVLEKRANENGPF
jgi:hypothetical protein